VAHIRRRASWWLPERAATPEPVYLGRRLFLRKAGLTGAAAALLGLGACRGRDGETPQAGAPASAPSGSSSLYPAPRSPVYRLDRPVTDEAVAGRYNNFYEFTPDKQRVAELASRFPLHPWQVEVAGLVSRPRVYDVDELARRFPLEERLYRHRCVEAWAMAVPWTGFAFRALLDEVEPLSSARFVRLVSFQRPELAAGQALQPWYPWPYHEGLTIQEAAHDLTLLATGIYGHPLPAQHGAPIRLVIPWKYGYKSIKSIVRIELVAQRPPTFWNRVAPAEYDFLANVDPAVPHPRWSQATERLLGTGQVVPTLPFNGYADLVASLPVS
jgi:sulfoxide reductase catalytic subunit YedY